MVTIVSIKQYNEMKVTLTKLQAENSLLRAALAHSKDPCLYCQLPVEEMAKCKAGFPGCGRADDMFGCPEFGAAMQLHDCAKRIEKLEAALERIKRVPVDLTKPASEAFFECLTIADKALLKE